MQTNQSFRNTSYRNLWKKSVQSAVLSVLFGMQIGCAQIVNAPARTASQTAGQAASQTVGQVAGPRAGQAAGQVASQTAGQAASQAL